MRGSLHILLILLLLLILAPPVVATAADSDAGKVIRARSEAGRDHIVVRRHGRGETIDMDALEEALAQLEGIDVDVAELVEEALEGLEDLDLDFEPNFSHRWRFDDEGDEGDFDGEEFEEWAERVGERMERWSEDFSRQMEQAFDGDGNGLLRHGVDWSSDSDEGDELRREIRELKRQIRSLKSELGGDDDGDS
jgi:polyhydroxyalkanoate synthesis regulator phasin